MDNKIKNPLIISIIPARGGSKGLKNKNIYPLLKKPLINYTIMQSLNSKMINFTYVSTNDGMISKIAKDCGSKVIKRPDSLSSDNSSSESAIIHALGEIKKDTGLVPDIVVFLQATSPLRLKNDIDNSIKQFINNDVDSLFSVTKISDLTLWTNEAGWESLNFNYKNRLMRQDRPSNYIENGSIYIFKPSLIKEKDNRIGGNIGAYEMEFWQTWEIDTMDEIDLVEFYLDKKGLNNFE